MTFFVASVFGDFPKSKHFWACFWVRFWAIQNAKERWLIMRKKKYKGRCTKRTLPKAEGVIKLYDSIQQAYADILQNDFEIKEIMCNVPLEGELDEYTTDFVCVKTNGDLSVRECAFRKYLTKPMTVKLLDASRDYWLRRGINDWGLVIDEEK